MNHAIVNEINDFFIKFKSNCNGGHYSGLSMVSELVIDIESDQLNTLFRRYKRVKDTYKTSGLGLGFILLQKLSKDAKVKFGWKAHFIRDLFSFLPLQNV